MAGQCLQHHLVTTINNVRLVGQVGLWQIAIADGKITAISPQPEQLASGTGVLDALGGWHYRHLLSHIFIWIRPKLQGNQVGTSLALCLRA